MSLLIPLAFLTGAPGPGEWILLFLVILLLFGPRRLPEIARMLGRMLEELRRASSEFRDQVMQIDESPPLDVSPEGEENTSHPGPLPGEREEAGNGEAPGTEDAADADPSTK